MKTSSLVLFAAACSFGLASLSAPSTAIAQEVKKASSEKQAKTAVTFRKSILQLVRSNIGPLGAMAKGNIPMDAEVIATNAQRIEFLAAMMHDYFALDTRAFPVDTGAKDLVWKEHGDFNSKVDDMVAAAANLQKMVANKEEANYRRGISAISRTCKGCHDKFQKE